MTLLGEVGHGAEDLVQKMGPGNLDRRLDTPEAALAPVWRGDQRYGTCARARIRAQTPQQSNPGRDGLFINVYWDLKEDEWMPGNHTPRQIFEKQLRINPESSQRSFYTRHKILGSELPQESLGREDVDGCLALGRLRLPAAGRSCREGYWTRP
jgi:hypothetical protein